MNTKFKQFDTGIYGENANRYRAVKQAILTGKLKPTVYALRNSQWHISQQIAVKYLDAMESDGLIMRNERGHRVLATQQGSAT